MSLTVGIIGLPQSGKTSLFNALTSAGAQISGYPTSTVQANRAVIAVPDERLGRLAEIYHPKKVTPTTVEFVDVAGIGQGSDESRREGLSAEFLGHIRNADALAIVLRCFTSAQVPAAADALRDLDELMAELALTDLATVDKRIDSTSRKAKSGDKKLLEEIEVLRGLREHLNTGRPASELTLTSQNEALVRELFLLTAKPRLYVVNVGEDVLGEAAELLARATTPATDGDSEAAQVTRVAARAEAEHAAIVAVSARLEAELRELSPEDAADYLATLGLPPLGTDRVIQAGYRTLNLISFLTAGEDEVRAWTVTRGSKAPTAAGKIHTDFERGFIRAEVVSYDDLMANGGSMKLAREHGKVRLEGKDYIVQDGDIIEFRFNVAR